MQIFLLKKGKKCVAGIKIDFNQNIAQINRTLQNLNLKAHIYFASLASTAQIGTNQYDIYHSRNSFKNSILYKDFIHHTNFMVIENESELQKYSLRQKKLSCNMVAF